jgi:ubiquinone/menaquinone biosynthesis C-methylase UbiE
MEVGIPLCIRPPDIDTATDAYRARFAGPVGSYFLDIQQRLVLEMLESEDLSNCSVLEIGGGHGQITEALLERGCRVCIHGSSPEALDRVRMLQLRFPEQLEFVVASYEALPFSAQSFDAVIAIRLLAHIDDYTALFSEMARISRRKILFDFAPVKSFNVFYPFCFWLKKLVEKNTRTFRRHRLPQLKESLSSLNFGVTSIKAEFFIPMFLHRLINNVGFSRRAEATAAAVGLTNLMGSPIIVLAEELASKM